MRTLRAALEPLISAARARQKKRAAAKQSLPGIFEPQEMHLIDRLVEATEGEKPLWTPQAGTAEEADYKLIEDQLINILLAARDTVSRSLVVSEGTGSHIRRHLC
jgi:hypothetical protein